MAIEYSEDRDSDQSGAGSLEFNLDNNIEDETSNQLGLSEDYDLVRYNDSDAGDADGVLILPSDKDLDSIREFLSDELKMSQDIVMPSHFVGSLSTELMENGYDAGESIIASADISIEEEGARYIRISF